MWNVRDQSLRLSFEWDDFSTGKVVYWYVGTNLKGFWSLSELKLAFEVLLDPFLETETCFRGPFWPFSELKLAFEGLLTLFRTEICNRGSYRTETCFEVLWDPFQSLNLPFWIFETLFRTEIGYRGSFWPFTYLKLTFLVLLDPSKNWNLVLGPFWPFW